MPFAATLRWVVASSATSYGYTLTVWATTAVVLHRRLAHTMDEGIGHPASATTCAGTFRSAI